MKASGLVIFQDGTLLPFGNYVGPGDVGYMDSPTHTTYFMNEIVPSDTFQSSEYIYDESQDIYHNAARFSLDGLLYVANHQYSVDSPLEILVYVPPEPTEEQLSVLKQQEVLLQAETQEVCEFHSLNFNDYEEYKSLMDYIFEKENSKTM